MTLPSVRSTLLSFLSLLIVAGASCLGGCATTSGARSTATTETKERELAPFFDDVPASTPFVFAGLEPVADALPLESGQGSASTYLRWTSRMMGSGPLPPPIDGLVAEVRDADDADAIRGLGLTPSPRFALYGLGPVPVLKWEIDDASALRETLDRLAEENSTVERGRRNGRRFRVYGDGSDAVAIALRDKALVAAWTPKPALDPVVAHLVGDAMPERKLADTARLADLRETYGLDPRGVGMLNVEATVETLAGVRSPDSAVRRVWSALPGLDLPENPAEPCRREAERIANAVPRGILGLVELEGERLSAVAGLEIRHGLMTSMAEAHGGVPALESPSFERAALALGMGLKMNRVSELAARWADDVFSTPYRCESFQAINRSARRVDTTLAALPNWSRTLQGLSLVVEEVRFDARSQRPQELKAMLFARSVDGPTMLRQLGLFVPGLNKLDLEADGKPARLKQVERRAPFLQSPHVAMRDHLVAFSIGADMREEMALILEKAGANASKTDRAAAALSIEPASLERGLPSAWVPAGLIGDGSPTTHRLHFELKPKGVFLRYSSTPTSQ